MVRDGSLNCESLEAPNNLNGWDFVELVFVKTPAINMIALKHQKSWAMLSNDVGELVNTIL